MEKVPFLPGDGPVDMNDAGSNNNNGRPLPHLDESRLRMDPSASTNPVSCCLSIMCPIVWLCSCFTVYEQTEVVQMHFGKFSGRYTEPGCHCSNPCGRQAHSISKRKQAIEVSSKVADLHGNPLNVSAVITYCIENPVRAALAVENPHVFVQTSATAVLKQVVARYPYEERRGEHAEHNLKQESAVVSQEAVQLLQERVQVAGARVISFSFCELSYAPEIAMNMLKKQVATALIESRTTIVRGAVDIAHHAIQELERKGIQLTPDEKDRLLTDLLSTICGDEAVQ